MKRAILLLALPFALGLAGCQGTLHSRWTEQSDTVDYWAPQMNTIPVDVHGTVPGATPEETVARIPLGTTASDFAGKHPTLSGIESVPRIVLHVGGDQIPTDATYCSANPQMRSIDGKDGHVMLAAALCDGTRLIVRSRRELTPDGLATDKMSSTLKSVKSRLLYGIEISRAQTPIQFNG